MDEYCYMSEEDVGIYLLSGSRANKNRRSRYEQGKQKIIKLIEVISKSAGSICLKTGWKVNLEKYNKIYKKVV